MAIVGRTTLMFLALALVAILYVQVSEAKPCCTRGCGYSRCSSDCDSYAFGSHCGDYGVLYSSGHNYGCGCSRPHCGCEHKTYDCLPLSYSCRRRYCGCRCKRDADDAEDSSYLEATSE